MTASVITASFVVSGGRGLLVPDGAARRACGDLPADGRDRRHRSRACWSLFPTGDRPGEDGRRSPAGDAGGHGGVFAAARWPNSRSSGSRTSSDRKLENPIVVPGILSFLAYGSFGSTVKGLDDFPESEWPHNVELLYYAYHIMAGLGTIFLLVMGTAAYLLWRGRLAESRRMLWVLMLSVPFPYIATTAGWWTAELGRQPWLVHGLLRTVEGGSPADQCGRRHFHHARVRRPVPDAGHPLRFPGRPG